MSAGAAPAPVGGAPFSEVITAMEEKNLSVSACRSKLVTRDMVDEADIVIAFPTPQMPDYVLNSSKTRVWEVTDPYYAPTTVRITFAWHEILSRKK